MLVRIRHPERLIYPETDGKPIGENTLQFQWIVLLFNGLDALFRDRPDVFVAGDLFWYPVHGDPTTVTAPDVLVAFGRPKGHRRSYKQWEEGNVAPQVAFEVQSPSNSAADLEETRQFYRRYGVEEYYLYDPETFALTVQVRRGRQLARVKPADGFVSPRLGVRFEVPGDGPMRVIGPDGRPFRSYQELLAGWEAEQRRADAARRQTDVARRQADAARRQADALAAKLRELGVDPDTV